MSAPGTNPTIESIMTTRAIRHFSAEPVTDEELRTCLAAAQQGPSGGNVQPQQYVVVTDPERKAAIAGWYRAAFDRYDRWLPEPREFRDETQARSWARTRDASRYLADNLAEAPALVIFLQPVLPWTPSDADGEMDIGRLDASVYPAVQNFCVAARSLGLGTALTTVIRIHTADVLAELGVPTGRFEIAALVPVGRPVGRFGVAMRKPADAVTHWDAWGDRRYWRG